MSHTFLFGSLFIALTSLHTCSSQRTSLEPGAYIDWSDNTENGLVVSKQVGRLTFELQYKSPDYVVLKDNAGINLTEKELKQQKSDIKDMQYFTFRISSDKDGDLLRDDISSVDNFSSRLQYFSSAMQKDLKLIENKDTLPCLLFHFERTYGIDPRSTFVLGFPLGKKDGDSGYPSVADKIFFFNDHELDAGPVYLTIDADKINQIPFLNLQ